MTPHRHSARQAYALFTYSQGTEISLVLVCTRTPTHAHTRSLSHTHTHTPHHRRGARQAYALFTYSQGTEISLVLVCTRTPTHAHTLSLSHTHTRTRHITDAAHGKHTHFSRIQRAQRSVSFSYIHTRTHIHTLSLCLSHTHAHTTSQTRRTASIRTFHVFKGHRDQSLSHSPPPPLSLAHTHMAPHRRGARQAYALFTYPKGTEISLESQQRLDALQEFGVLGSGYQLAQVCVCERERGVCERVRVVA